MFSETFMDPTSRRLLQPEEVTALLQLPDDDLQWLIDTKQLCEIQIRGHRRFDSADVYQLIAEYKSTSQRRSTT